MARRLLLVCTAAAAAAAAAVFARSAATVAADPSWLDGFFDAPPVNDEPAAGRLAAPPKRFRRRVVDHELGRPKRSSDDMYFESPFSSRGRLFSSSCDDYNLWVKSAAVVLVTVTCLAALLYLAWCCRKCHSVNKEHGYCGKKCHGHCAFSSNEQCDEQRDFHF